MTNAFRNLCIKCWLIAFTIATSIFSNTALAELMEPDPSKSNQQLWDSVMGAGHYERTSFFTRGVAVSLFFAFIAWVALGMANAYGNKKLKGNEAIFYFFRALALVTITITMFTL